MSHWTKCSALSTQSSDTCYRKLSEGVYLDNLKIGTWVYYEDGGCYISVEKTEIYKGDGSIVEMKYWNKVTTEYSTDSMLVFSEVYPNEGNICIECIGKKKCIATFENDVLVEFDFSSLDFEQYKMVMGFYNRKMKVIEFNNQN